MSFVDLFAGCLFEFVSALQVWKWQSSTYQTFWTWTFKKPFQVLELQNYDENMKIIFTGNIRNTHTNCYSSCSLQFSLFTVLIEFILIFFCKVFSFNLFFSSWLDQQPLVTCERSLFFLNGRHWALFEDSSRKLIFFLCFVNIIYSLISDLPKNNTKTSCWFLRNFESHVLNFHIVYHKNPLRCLFSSSSSFFFTLAWFANLYIFIFNSFFDYCITQHRLFISHSLSSFSFIR